MTEGTGGITMTPPGKYKEGTTGIALPGEKAGVVPVDKKQLFNEASELKL